MSKIEKTAESAIIDFFMSKSSDFFCVCNENFNILNVNQSFTKYVDKPVNYLINANIADLTANKILEPYLLKYLNLSSDDESSFSNNLINKEDGTLVPILWDIKHDKDARIYIINGKKSIYSNTEGFNDENISKQIADKINDSLFILDSQWNVVFQNELAIQTFNHADFKEDINRLFACFPENTNFEFVDHFKKSLEEKIPLQFVEPSILINKWFFIDVIPSDNKLYVLCKDISDKILEQKTNDLELKVFEMSIEKNKTVEELLSFLLIGMENLHPEMFSCVLKSEHQKLFFTSSPRLPEHYTDSLNGMKIGDCEGSYCPSAFIKKPIIVDDIETSEIWKDHAHKILPLGFKAWWSFPIIGTKNNEIMAIFSVYCKIKRKPTEIELKTIARISNIIKIILENFKHDDAILLSNNRYEMVTMATNDAIYDWDLAKDKVYWSENIYNIFGYEVKEVDEMQNWWANNLHPTDKHKTINNLKKCLKERESGWSAEYRLKCKNGKYKYVYDRAYIIYDKKGLPQTIIGAIQDISILKEREIEILTQNNKLKEIAQISSHELRRPVTSVLGLVSLFNKVNLTDETNKTVIEYLEHATKELDQVIHSIVAKTLEADYPLNLKEKH